MNASDNWKAEVERGAVIDYRNTEGRWLRMVDAKNAKADLDALNAGNYQMIDRMAGKTPEEVKKINAEIVTYNIYDKASLDATVLALKEALCCA